MKPRQNSFLRAAHLNTPLGLMIAVADEEALFFLDFMDRAGLQIKLDRLQQKMQSTIVFASVNPLVSIEEELSKYFNKEIDHFRTPVQLLGSGFQKQVWQELQNISFGETRAYAEIAHAVGKKTACRAVARANSTNSLAIIVPCHRVIQKNGGLGGYAGGIFRKQWLLDHER